MISGKAKVACTVPKLGYVAADDVKNFDIEDWDVKKYPYLKHFNKFDVLEEEAVEAPVASFPADPVSIF